MTETPNIAQHKQTQQSSLFENQSRFIANTVVDGIYKQDLDELDARCSHTSLELQPWWAVDLEAVYSIHTVVVFGRTDCCVERLSNFSIDAIRPCNNHSGWFDNSLTTRCSYQDEATIYAEHRCHLDTIGRYVRIQIHKLTEEYLTLCEVEVHGTIVNVSDDTKSTAATCDESTNTISSSFTRQEEGSVIIPPQNNTRCFCSCEQKQQTNVITHLDVYANEITPLDILVTRIKQELTIDKKNTSEYKRSKTSQRDTRLSSICIGVIGSGIIAVPVISIITCDIMNWFAQWN
ncbi:unnamed protein product [Mytilus edulis]|uniref:Fucolectin tachylectin-4 pentraxin-1 domain-containing protein n=1 Tax=Mytilus edulis TaxID=6550 RepID=A0A8S3RC82_MYTED|nr:unnamed protein product [Mytilus edulis]